LKYVTERKYLGSKDGFTANAFHEKADGIKPSVTLFLLTNGICIAGYTS